MGIKDEQQARRSFPKHFRTGRTTNNNRSLQLELDNYKRVGDALAAAVRSNHLQEQKDYDVGCHVCACLKAWEAL